MLTKREIIGSFVIFLIIYLIIFVDHTFNNFPKCKTYRSVSLKAPLIITLTLLTLYKLFYQNISSYLNNYYIVKQDIITDMVDF